MVVQRPDPHRVPGQEERPLVAVPHGEGEVADDPLRAPLAPPEVRLQEDLPVGVRAAEPGEPEGPLEVAPVVDPGVGREHVPAGRVGEREPLVRGLRGRAEEGVAEPGRAPGPGGEPVGAPVGHGGELHPDVGRLRRPAVPVARADDPAHRCGPAGREVRRLRGGPTDNSLSVEPRGPDAVSDHGKVSHRRHRHDGCR